MLRGWQDSDVELWAAMNADPRVMEFFPGIYSYNDSAESAARVRARLETDGFGWWIAQGKDDGAFHGVIALQMVPFDAHFTPAIEVGWRLPFASWGKGIASEGGAAAIRFAHDKLGYDEVVAMTAAINLRSRRVMERLGMTYDPRDDFENPRIAEGHALRPHVLYRIHRAR